ncbi:MAG: CvpA family protein [Spirochaetales bacterium]|nr:CvpA family protein [Spirochaetales bacterium]
MRFEIIDVVFAILILVAAVRGAFRGFVAEAGSAAALVLGISGAVGFHRPVARIIARSFGESMWNPLIAFLVLFLVIYIVVKLVERLLAAVFEKLNLDRLDSALGFFLGIAEGLLLVAVVLFLLNWQPFFDPGPLLGDSLFARFLCPLLPSPERIFQTGTKPADV